MTFHVVTRLLPALVSLKNDRAEEVLWIQVRFGDPELGDPTDVLPQRLPLLLLLPHVRALEQRDHEVLRQVEQLQRGALERLHERNPAAPGRRMPSVAWGPSRTRGNGTHRRMPAVRQLDGSPQRGESRPVIRAPKPMAAKWFCIEDRDAATRSRRGTAWGTEAAATERRSCTCRGSSNAVSRSSYPGSRPGHGEGSRTQTAGASRGAPPASAGPLTLDLCGTPWATNLSARTASV